MDSLPPFDWDGANIRHIGRHGVTPKEVEQAFRNLPDDLMEEEAGGEMRYSSIGHTDMHRVLVVVWTTRRRMIRPVTAYDADRWMAVEYLTGRGFGL